MLIFDATNSSASRWADFARAHLPMGMPVIGWEDADLASLGLVVADRAMGIWC
jgi:hypothetical protein